MTTTPGTTEKDCCRTLRHEPGHALDCTGRKHLDELERETGLRCHVCGSDDTMAIVAPGKSVCADCLDLSDQP